MTNYCSEDAVPGPLVSVMMPAYNVEKFVGVALDSLLAQTYSNWEAVVVDDGSTDGTARVLREYAQRDVRIRPFFMPHGGRGVARNTALSHCKGEFVALLDSDDLAMPDRFEKQVRYLEAHPGVSVVSGQCISFNGEPIADPAKLMPWPTDSEEICQSLLQGRMRILNGASMLRKRVFDEHGRYRVELRRAQDYEFFRRLALAGVRMAATGDVAILYRQEQLIPSLNYYLESELYRHYANALHRGFAGSFEEFKHGNHGRAKRWMTYLRYVYLYVKLAIRYRRFG